MLHKALGSSRPFAARQRALPNTETPAEAPAAGLQVDPAYGICHWQGRMASLTRGSALLLQTLQRAYPLNVPRTALRLREAVGGHLPTVLVTGEPGHERAEASRLAGFTVRGKPLRPAQLRAFMNQAFARSEAR